MKSEAKHRISFSLASVGAPGMERDEDKGKAFSLIRFLASGIEMRGFRIRYTLGE